MTRGSAGRGVVSTLAAATLALATAGNVARAQDGDESRNRRVEVIRVAGGGPRLGIDIEDVHGDDVARLKLAEERGALVRGVAKGSAGEKAGLKEGDVILGYQGEKVWSSAQLRRLVHETPAGRKVSLEISRGGAVQRLAASVEEARDSEMARGEDSFHFDVPMPPVPAMPPMPPIPPMDRLLEDGARGRRFLFRDRGMDGRPGRLGFAYEEVAGQLARYFKVDDGGLLVTDVEADGPAGRAGLRAGDIVVKVQGKVVSDSEALHRALEDVAPGTEVALTIQRDGHPLELKVTPRAGGERRERGERS